MMTLEEIERCNKPCLTPEDVRGVLECDPQFIRIAARSDQNRELLGFPTTIIGKRTKIPRIPFLNYIKGVRENVQTN